MNAKGGFVGYDSISPQCPMEARTRSRHGICLVRTQHGIRVLDLHYWAVGAQPEGKQVEPINAALCANLTSLTKNLDVSLRQALGFPN